jgi:hypothetical protein
MNSIIHYSLKYEVKGFEDKNDYFVDRISSSQNEKLALKELDVEKLIVQHLINDRNYPTVSIIQEYVLSKLHRPDIVIIENDIILAVIEVKTNIEKAIPQLERYYSKIIQNQNIHPKLFVTNYSEDFETFYEYNIKNNVIEKVTSFPYYNELLTSSVDKVFITNSWNSYIKNIDLVKLSKVQRNVEDENFQEALKARDFLKSYDKKLRKKIPFLINFNSKPNSHPNQPQWTPENGIRYSYYIGDKYLNGIQLNITLWANWHGGIFIKDNENIIFADKKLLDNLVKKYNNLEFSEIQKDIFSKRFNNGIPSEEILIQSLNNLIDLLKDVDKEKNIFKDITEDIAKQDNEKKVFNENNGLAIASQNNDNPKGEDSLDIASDVNALSKLIAYEKLDPPLSIGLFGEWGSGKSFFMNEIHKKVDSLSSSNNKVFCQNIVHIEFNAWHYSDSNLWASLVSKIFNTLNDKIKGTENKNSLFEKLQFSQDRLSEIKIEQEKINDKIKQDETELKEEEEKKVNKSIEIKNITISSITQTVFNDKTIKSEVTSLKNELEEVGVINENDINSFTSLVSDISTIHGTVRRFFSVFANERSFIWWIIGLAILGLITAFCISQFFEKQYFLQVVTPLLLFTIPILNKLSKFVKKLKQFSPKVNDFLDNYELKKQEVLKENNKQTIEKQNEIEKLVNNINQLQFKLSSSAKIMEKLNDEINDIKSGKYLADFIAERSDDYNSRLGLISIIRDDFEKLSSYLKNETDEVKIDRIILYIDDLDRCKNDLVINVLEAIHLLLAFDLFVVIVGVDIRWISNSLNVKYENIDMRDNQTEKATPLEYLEKIFQIPFHLEKTTDKSKKMFIERLLRPNLVQENSEIQPSPHTNTTKTNNSENTADTDKAKDSSPEAERTYNQELEHQHVSISIDELNYIKSLSTLISPSPRNIKRFINIYMIIKSHERIHTYHDNKHYQSIIFLLTIVFIKPKSLLQINDQKSLNELIKNTDLSEVDEETRKSIEQLNFDTVKEHLKFLLRFSFRDDLIDKSLIKPRSEP